ncbi:MAG: transporter substrate-binding domain-containing protein [Burkholderiales bacterium]|nr:transporter substrate-binding domain-containing protein [Burkholderiales bacterium]
MMKRFVITLFVALAAFAQIVEAKADTLANILKNGVIRVAILLDAPPFGSINQQRQPEGFDHDLAEMIAKGLGVKLEIQSVTGPNRIPFLLTDKVDIIVAFIGLTPERARQVMFTAPYAESVLGVYGPKSTVVKSAAELGKLRVVTPKGGTPDIALTAMNPRANIMRTEDDATAATAYMTGQADLFATNSTLLSDYMKRSPKTEFDLKFILRRSPAHIAVRMGDFTMLQWLNSFIFFNTMNGELDKLHQKWLGGPMQPLPTL